MTCPWRSPCPITISGKCWRFRWVRDPQRGPGPVTFKLTREHIANMMGMTRQGVHGVLKALEQRGLIRFSYGRITVPDPDALKAYLDERAG